MLTVGRDLVLCLTCWIDGVRTMHVDSAAQ
jgi:hypothetical protein